MALVRHTLSLFNIMQSTTSEQGGPAKVYTLTSSELTVRVADIGARLLSFEYGGVDLVHGPHTPDELAADTCYCGAICGRVANRIAGALSCILSPASAIATFICSMIERFFSRLACSSLR